MIRRLFWLTLGAVLGVTGYRRAEALARSLSPVRRANGIADFTADVREGMAVYMERQAAPPPSTLEGHRGNGPGRRLPAPRPSASNELKDGR